MTDISSTIALVCAGLALVVGNGFAMKLVTSSFRESMRETFLTKDSAKETFLTKEKAAAQYASIDEIKRVEREVEKSREEMWSRITDHVIEPLNRIADRVDDLFKLVGHGQADGAR
jgi:hypothetical protein